MNVSTSLTIVRSARAQATLNQWCRDAACRLITVALRTPESSDDLSAFQTNYKLFYAYWPNGFVRFNKFRDWRHAEKPLRSCRAWKVFYGKVEQW
jgi:hypothetical protein